MAKMSKADQQVVKDEADAEIAEGKRQAIYERARVIKAAEVAEIAAANECTADEAKATFWDKFMKAIGWSQ